MAVVFRRSRYGTDRTPLIGLGGRKEVSYGKTKQVTLPIHWNVQSSVTEWVEDVISRGTSGPEICESS